MLTRPLQAIFAAPLMRRIGFHARRIGGEMDRHFFTSLLSAVIGFVVVAAVVITLLEDEKRSFAGFGSSFYWAITTVIGSGDASYVSSPGGSIIGWVLAFFGVAIVAAMTGAVVGFFIDILLKEGQGMGAAGYRDHIVVCRWNTTARDLIEELKGDEFTTKVVVLHDSERNPAGEGVYFVRGDITSTEDLEDRHPGGELGHRLPVRPQQRGRHALDPGGHGHRGDRAGRADGRRGQQSCPCRPLPARRCGRDPGHLAPRVAPAGEIGPVSRPVGARHRYRLRR